MRHRDSEHVEFFAFGHPVVDALRERVTDDGYPGNASAFRPTAVGDETSACSGWLFNFEIAVPGIRTVGRMLPVFVDDDGGVSAEKGQLLLERSTRFPGDPAIDDFETGTLARAAEAAEAYVELELHRVEEEVHRESEVRLGREEQKLEDYFAYRERTAADRVEATERILARIEASVDQEERRILPVWKANLDREQLLLDELRAEKGRRLAELRGRLRPSGDYKLVSAARVVQTVGAAELLSAPHRR
jgi:hypothetical protein